jgi:NitT/TauT family transport system substrate-binding protein
LIRVARAAGIVLSLALFCLVSLGGFAANAAELIPFRVGEAAPANTFLAIWMAQAAGFYEAQGLQLEIVPMVGGSESGPELKAGNVHLIHIGMSSVVRANMTRRGDLRSIGSLSNVIRSTMFAAPNVKTGADLKGGIIGISSVGSESDSTATLALRRLGLTRQDITVKEIGVERLAAVRDGRVAATVLGEPQRSEAFALGLNPIFDFYAERIPWLYSGLTVDHDYLKDHRDTLVRFLKATIEAIIWPLPTRSAPRMCWPESSSSAIRKSSTRATPTSKLKRLPMLRSTVPAPKTFSPRWRRLAPAAISTTISI